MRYHTPSVRLQPGDDRRRKVRSDGQAWPSEQPDEDFYDIWLLSRQFGFDGPSLATALEKTFAHRGTPTSKISSHTHIRPFTESRLTVEIEVPKSDSLGKSRFKLPVYDLTVFLRILAQERHLPHFLVHDGAFNGIDVKTVVQFLNYIEAKATTLSSLQYIVTLNEDQVYVSEKSRTSFEGLGFEIVNRVIAHYEDVPEKMILRREF